MFLAENEKELAERKAQITELEKRIKKQAKQIEEIRQMGVSRMTDVE